MKIFIDEPKGKMTITNGDLFESKAVNLSDKMYLCVFKGFNDANQCTYELLNMNGNGKTYNDAIYLEEDLLNLIVKNELAHYPFKEYEMVIKKIL